jgi:hypothetical protein
MALPGTSWHYRAEPSFPNSEATPVGCKIPQTASEAGGRAFAAKRGFASARQRSGPRGSRPGHHLISRTWRTPLPSTDPQLYRTTPNQFLIGNLGLVCSACPVYSLGRKCPCALSRRSAVVPGLTGTVVAKEPMWDRLPRPFRIRCTSQCLILAIGREP